MANIRSLNTEFLGHVLNQQNRPEWCLSDLEEPPPFTSISSGLWSLESSSSIRWSRDLISRCSLFSSKARSPKCSKLEFLKPTGVKSLLWCWYVNETIMIISEQLTKKNHAISDANAIFQKHTTILTISDMHICSDSCKNYCQYIIFNFIKIIIYRYMYLTTLIMIIIYKNNNIKI